MNATAGVSGVDERVRVIELLEAKARRCWPHRHRSPLHRQGLLAALAALPLAWVELACVSGHRFTVEVTHRERELGWAEVGLT